MNRLLPCCFRAVLKKFLCLWLYILVLPSACKTDLKKSEPLFKLLSAEKTGVSFSNDIIQSDTMSILNYMYFYNGGGVGLGDINNDGLTDIFLSGNMVPSKLYLNKGNFQFEDITERAGLTTKGWCTGVAMTDLNSDGFLDIYVSRAGSQDATERTNLLFINNGNDTFTESAAEYGIADTGYTTQAAFFDYDKDGDVDLYLLTHDHSPKAVNNLLPIKKQGEANSTDKLFRNDGIGPKGHPIFTNVSAQAGILIEGYGLGVAINDLNDDGWPDIYVANDFLSNDLLYINNRDGTFSNKITDCLKHQSYNAMGVDVSDFDNDGLQDIVVMDMLPEGNYRQKMMSGSMTNEKSDYMRQMGYNTQYMRNTLQLNRGGGHFSEIGQLAGIDKSDWSWSPLLADFDNDGYKDLFITNGYLKDITDRDFISFSQNKTMFKDGADANKTLLELMEGQKGVKIPNCAFRNNHDLTFTKVPDWGLEQASYSNGAAFGDLDNDGDLDLVVNNINDKAFIYKNEAQRLAKNNFLTISLRGDSLNRMALGTKVVLRYQGKTQVHEHTLYRGYQSTVASEVHFGLGNSSSIDTLDVYWPDGKKQRLLHQPTNRHLTLNYEKTDDSFRETAKKTQPLFTDVAEEVGIRFVHQEDSYSDLTNNPLLPQTHTTLGPSLAAGDVDGDGLDDFYVGGAAGSAGVFYRQQLSGKFVRQEFRQDAACEDTGSLLFDADNDGDLDLYVVSGGSEFTTGSPLYQDRLYKNDGRGNFRKDLTALPAMHASKAVVTAADFDRDGDLDLFVGGRVSPGSYPQSPESYILNNENGKFTDVTEKVSSALRQAGLVTAALWTDFDNDGQTDLLVVGEWMPITFFRNVEGRLINVTKSIWLGDTSGWWNSLVGGDMDNDGDTDYLLGNLGLNTPFKATRNEPLTIHAGDLDGSGQYHPLLSWYIQGKNSPWSARDVLLRQMPRLGKKFFKYDDYAKAALEDIVLSDVREKALVLKSSYFASSYLENLGGGKFRLKPLPAQAQIAPVNGMVIKDFDDDGNLDALLTGNSYAPDVSIGRYDAFMGLYLKGDGKGGFSHVSTSKSGFLVDSDARSLIQVYTRRGNALLMSASNADKMSVFRQVTSPKTKLLKLGRTDAFGMLQISRTQQRKVEFYYGSGYLSQSSRTMEVADGIDSWTITDSRGKEHKHVR